MEAPAAHFVAVVDGAGPLVGGLVFGFGLVGFLAFDFDDEHAAVFEADEVVGFVEVAEALVLVGDEEAHLVVAGVALDQGVLFRGHEFQGVGDGAFPDG